MTKASDLFIEALESEGVEYEWKLSKVDGLKPPLPRKLFFRRAAVVRV